MYVFVYRACYHGRMKTIFSLITVLALVFPVATRAYFVDDFTYTRTVDRAPQYIPDPSLDFLPGWPDWIGRLNLFSQYVYGRRYQDLDRSQQQVVEQLSQNWPGWIGVPTYLRFAR